MAETSPEKSRVVNQTEYITVGEVLGAWGLKGAFRVRPTTDFPERFEPGETIFIDGAPFVIRSSNRQKDGVIITLAGIDTPEAAARLRRKTLDIPASALRELPEGQYYQFDIIGLEVQHHGRGSPGQSDGHLELRERRLCGEGGGGKEVLIPATKDVVKSIDLKSKKMVIEPIEGLLE